MPESRRVSGGTALFLGWAVVSWTVPWAVVSFLQFDPWLAPWAFNPREPFTVLVPVVYVLYCCFLMPLVLLVTGLFLPGRRWRWRIGWSLALFVGFCFEAGAIRYGFLLHVTPYYSTRPTTGPLVACGGFLLLALWLWLLLAGRPRLARRGVRAVPRAVFSMATRTRGRRALTACLAFLIVAVAVTRASGPVLAAPLAGTAVTTVAFSPDGRDVAFADADEWLVRSVPANRMVLAVDGEQASALAFSPDGTVIASGGLGIQAWNTVTGRELFRFAGTANVAVRALAFSPDGAVIASGDDSGVIFLLNAATGRPLVQLASAASGVDGLAFNSDGRELASAAYDGTVTLRDTATGAVLARTAVPAVAGAGPEGARPVSVSFLPGGTTVAIGDARSGLYAWTPSAGRLARKLSWTCGGGFACADSVAFSPSGAAVAVTGQGAGGRGACVWSTASGALIARVDDPAYYAVASAAVSQNGDDLAIGDDDGSPDSASAFGPSGYVFAIS